MFAVPVAVLNLIDARVWSLRRTPDESNDVDEVVPGIVGALAERIPRFGERLYFKLSLERETIAIAADCNCRPGCIRGSLLL